MNKGTKVPSTVAILIGCMLASVVSATTVIATTVSVFIVPISSEFHWSRAEFPLAIMAAAWTGGLIAPLAGRTLDRLGTKPVMIAGAVVFGLANIVLAFSDGRRWHVFPGYMLLGAASSFTGIFGVNKIISAHFAASRGRALGLTVGVGVGLGSAMTPLLVQFCIQTQSWRLGYIALGVMVIALTLPAVSLLTPNVISARSNGARGDLTVEGMTPLQAMCTREFWLLLILILTNGFAAGAIGGHWVPVQMERGVSVGVATLLLSVFGLVKVGAQLAGGVLLDRFQTARLALAILAPVLLSAALYAFARSPIFVYPAALFFGLGEGAELGLLPYMVSRYFGLRRFAEVFGFFAAGSIISAGVGNVVMGKMFDITKDYNLGLHASVASLALSIIAAAFLGQYRYAATANFITPNPEEI